MSRASSRDYHVIDAVESPPGQEQRRRSFAHNEVNRQLPGVYGPYRSESERPIARHGGPRHGEVAGPEGWETMEPLLVFLFGVAVGLAMMYVICDLGLAVQDREELHRLLRWRRWAGEG